MYAEINLIASEPQPQPIRNTSIHDLVASICAVEKYIQFFIPMKKNNWASKLSICTIHNWDTSALLACICIIYHKQAWIFLFIHARACQYDCTLQKTKQKQKTKPQSIRSLSWDTDTWEQLHITLTITSQRSSWRCCNVHLFCMLGLFWSEKVENMPLTL